MATKKKLLQAAAGVGGAGLNVEEVFSTYLYDGNGSTQTITNGVDLSGEGGLVWIKNRSRAVSNALQDTERGYDYLLKSDATTASTQYAPSVGGFGGFNSDGFDLIADAGGFTYWNYNGDTYASWTFRKAPKFFDVVTYTGNSTAGRTVSHNLGSVPGMIIIKNLDVAVPWAVYHRSMGDGVGGGADENYYMNLNENFARAASSSYWNNTAPTSTTFTLGTANRVNATGSTYVAYLFAHNDGDGGFGPTGDQDIIKCGSYIGNATSVDLGFEPQFIIVKRLDSAENWMMFDSMRGWNADGNSLGWLMPNQASAESTLTIGNFGLTSTGFKMSSGYTPLNNGSASSTYIYIAIRRGPMAVPTSATDVFDIDVSTASQPYTVTTSLNYVDATINRVLTSGQAFLHNRLTGSRWMFTDSTNAETNSPNDVKYDFNGKVMPYFYTNNTNHVNYMWRRAPNYFDAVAYSGNSTAGRTITHNLGVAPEMIWVKRRNSTSNWSVYHSDVGNTKYLVLNTFNASTTFNYWNDTDPTATTFGVSSAGAVNNSSDTYIAYLFASLAGVSKVGSFTHSSGAATDVDCGFSSGARFILVKRFSAGGDWMIWDTARGIVAGDDLYLELNNTNAEITGDDLVDPLSSGFTFTGGNADGTYLFYAIA